MTAILGNPGNFPGNPNRPPIDFSQQRGLEIPPMGMDPGEFADRYAKTHNMSKKDAIKFLKDKFGDPQKPQVFSHASSSSYSAPVPPTSGDDSDRIAHLKELGIPQEIIDKGDEAIRLYAEEHNIKIPPKEER